MLHIDSLLLEAFYEENKDFFINARVQKIQQPTRREVILQMRNNGESKKIVHKYQSKFSSSLFYEQRK